MEPISVEKRELFNKILLKTGFLSNSRKIVNIFDNRFGILDTAFNRIRLKNLSIESILAAINLLFNASNNQIDVFIEMFPKICEVYDITPIKLTHEDNLLMSMCKTDEIDPLDVYNEIYALREKSLNSIIFRVLAEDLFKLCQKLDDKYNISDAIFVRGKLNFFMQFEEGNFWQKLFTIAAGEVSNVRINKTINISDDKTLSVKLIDYEETYPTNNSL